MSTEVEQYILSNIQTCSSTATQLAVMIGKGLKTIQVCLRTLHEAKKVYVFKWVRSDNGRNWMASYKACPDEVECVDVEYPGPRKKRVKPLTQPVRSQTATPVSDFSALLQDEVALAIIRLSIQQPLEPYHESV